MAIARIPILGAGPAPLIAPRDERGLVGVWRPGRYRMAISTDLATVWVTVVLGEDENPDGTYPPSAPGGPPQG
jgi:hypothetical protein